MSVSVPALVMGWASGRTLGTELSSPLWFVFPRPTAYVVILMKPEELVGLCQLAAVY